MARPVGLKYLSATVHERELSSHQLRESDILVTCSGTLGRVGLVTKAYAGWIGSQHIARITAHQVHPGYLYAFLASRFGQVQITAQTYGAVVDEVTADQLGSIAIPVPAPDVQARIGDPVLRAYELNEEANALEMHGVRRIELLVERASAGTSD